MTAEIAILNRSAVALAADSAVTLGVRGQQKIYNSVDKLFHLCLSEPVGIMIFGGAEYMGVPIETVIKKFRSSKYAAPKKFLKEYSGAFFEFLEKEIPVPKELEEENIERIIGSMFAAIDRKVFERYTVAARAGDKRALDPKFWQGELGSLTKALIVSLNKQADSPFVDASTDDEWCKSVAKKAMNEAFRIPIAEEAEPLLLELACLLLRKERYSSGAMGLVFAGFGTDELFPKLQAFNSDGLIRGRVKRHEFQYIDIKRTGDNSGARIEAFAQKEMVYRFLDGIDPDFESYLRSSMKEALTDLGKHIVETFVKGTKKKKTGIAAQISEAADKYLAEFGTKSDKRKEENFRQKILDMVNFMPKSDLANMAESLINLTSTKRRVSAESETVGGPVDVAVISKYDGFVWIRRKHYFEKELNPRYFVEQHLHSRSPQGGDNEQSI